MNVLDRAAYAARLFACRNQGVIVPLQSVEVPLENDDVWTPQANNCHLNCAQLAKFYPEQFSAVRGWLVFDAFIVFGRVEFMPHSVVRDIATGGFFDPTPQRRAQPDYVFIPETAVDGDYDRIAGSLAHGEMLVHEVH